MATDDYMRIADNALFDVGASESFTVLVLAAVRDANSANHVFLSKQLWSNGTGWSIYQRFDDKLQFKLKDGPAEINVLSTSAFDYDVSADINRIYTIAGVRDAGSTAYIYGGSSFVGDAVDTVTASMANSEELRLGSYADGTNFLDGTVIGAAFTKQALTAQQIADVADALIARNGGTP